ncbi:hypothetical protein CC80DRAFT_545510 [Byssothecium circinans]|uniref:Beta-lactamase/transpeptidase-like protein n=1 Tax=Byssothecium circinans TaxID=147558 RepID=A0A6A5U8B4_9PLEO|nr:hypothetical protein CC80DRAFT_545510 [Byssothecium circinans]
MGVEGTGYEGQSGGSVAAKKEGRKEGRFWGQSLKHRDDGGVIVPVDPVQTLLDTKERKEALPATPHHVFPLDKGLVSNVADLAHIFSILTPQNGGIDPITGTRILSAEAAREIRSAQLPEKIRNHSRNVRSTTMPDLALPKDLQAAHLDPEGSYGLACAVQGADRVLESGKRGRSKGTAYWYGAINLDYWIDGEKGIVVLLQGNFMPWNDEDWVEMVSGVEERIYAALD